MAGPRSPLSHVKVVIKVLATSHTMTANKNMTFRLKPECMVEPGWNPLHEFFFEDLDLRDMITQRCDKHWIAGQLEERKARAIKDVFKLCWNIILHRGLAPHATTTGIILTASYQYNKNF